jgi:hypothetical protein
MDTSELRKHLLETLLRENKLAFKTTNIVEDVIRGITLCERAGFDWKKSALSYRHIVNGERMAVILVFPCENPSIISSEQFNEALKKAGIDMRNRSLDNYALQTEHPASFHLNKENEEKYKLQRYVWIQAALFEIEGAADRRLDTVSRICREPSRY